MAKQHEFETSIEVLRGEGDDAEYVEVELLMRFDVQGPEPDVGLFGFGAEDVSWYQPNGDPLPADVQAAIDADPKFEERQIERALEDMDDSGDDDRPDYDD